MKLFIFNKEMIIHLEIIEQLNRPEYIIQFALTINTLEK